MPQTTEALLVETSHLSAEAVSLLQSRLQGFEDIALARLLAFLKKFDTVDGRFVGGEKSAAVLNTIKRELRGVVEMKELDRASKEFVANFDAIGENVRAVHGEENGIKVPKSLVNASKQYAIDATEFSLRQAGIDLKFIEPVRKALYGHINFGAGVLETEQALRALIGPDATRGALSQWVGQVATDAINQYEGVVQQAIATENGLTGVRYVNSIIDTSRPQCIRWVDMEYITEEELASEIQWAKDNGSGMIAETTADTFLIYRGGYRCRHKGIPIRNEVAKKKAAARAEGKPGPGPTPPIPPPPAPAPVPPPPAPTPAPAPPKPAPKKKAPRKAKGRDIEELVKRFDKLVAAESLITTAKPDRVRELKALMAEQNGALEVIAERGTRIALRAPSQRTVGGTRKLLLAAGSKLSVYDIGTIKESKGNAAVTNAFMNVVVAATDRIRFERVDLSFSAEHQKDQALYEGESTRFGNVLRRKTGEIVAVPKDEGWWPVTVSAVAKGNPATTLTHETAHIIHNKWDPYRNGDRLRLQRMASEAGVKLKDAPTWYGSSNWSEFWAETFTAYVYANAWLKSTRPKTFDLFEAALKEYGIDKSTIAIAK